MIHPRNLVPFASLIVLKFWKRSVFILLTIFVSTASAEPPPQYLLEWGSNGSSDGEFASPYGVTTDHIGNVYVVEFGNHRVQKFGSDGTYFGKWGSFGFEDGQFFIPWGLAADNTSVYVVEFGNHRVQRFASEGAFVTKWGQFGLEDSQFSSPRGLR